MGLWTRLQRLIVKFEGIEFMPIMEEGHYRAISKEMVAFFCQIVPPAGWK